MLNANAKANANPVAIAVAVDNVLLFLCLFDLVDSLFMLHPPHSPTTSPSPKTPYHPQGGLIGKVYQWNVIV